MDENLTNKGDKFRPQIRQNTIHLSTIRWYIMRATLDMYAPIKTFITIVSTSYLSNLYIFDDFFSRIKKELVLSVDLLNACKKMR